MIRTKQKEPGKGKTTTAQRAKEGIKRINASLRSIDISERKIEMAPLVGELASEAVKTSDEEVKRENLSIIVELARRGVSVKSAEATLMRMAQEVELSELACEALITHCTNYDGEDPSLREASFRKLLDSDLPGVVSAVMNSLEQIHSGALLNSLNQYVALGAARGTIPPLPPTTSDVAESIVSFVNERGGLYLITAILNEILEDKLTQLTRYNVCSDITVDFEGIEPVLRRIVGLEDSLEMPKGLRRMAVGILLCHYQRGENSESEENQAKAREITNSTDSNVRGVYFDAVQMMANRGY